MEAFVIALGYILGSIPFGLLFSKMAGLGDVRKIGSGNIGATNVLRTGNKKIAALTLLCDLLKGTAAVLIALHLSPSSAFFAGFAAIIGHIFPVWLKFKGGKGVATSLGVYFAISWPLGLLTCLTWLIAAKLFRISSLSALIAFMLSPIVAYGLLHWQHSADKSLFLFCNMICLTILTTHYSNISRLLRGNESAIGK